MNNTNQILYLKTAKSSHDQKKYIFSLILYAFVILEANVKHILYLPEIPFLSSILGIKFPDPHNLQAATQATTNNLAAVFTRPHI